MRLQVDDHSPIPIRRQLAEQLRHYIEGGGFPPDRALPSIRELAGFLGINPNTVARAMEDLKQSGYVEARRGKGLFVAHTAPRRPSAALREAFLREAVIRAAALGMTADELAVGVLSLAGVRPPVVRGLVEVLLVECSPEALEFFARELESQLPVRVEKVLPDDLQQVLLGGSTDRWRAAVTSFFHLPEVAHLLHGTRIPVIALLAGARIETLQRLAELPVGTRVGVASSDHHMAHNLEHSIVNAGLPNIALVGSCPAEGAALDRLVRQVEVMVCSTPAAERVRGLLGPSGRVIIDDPALDRRAIETLAGILVGVDGSEPSADPRPPEGGDPASELPTRTSDVGRGSRGARLDPGGSGHTIPA
jgi:GntR family transcriptional regulator